MLLIGFHWQRRDEPSEKDRLFCFDEKMSPKGDLFNASLPFRLQKVVSQYFLIFINSELILKM